MTLDGYFAKKTLVDPVTKLTDFHIISKLRRDANLKYLYYQYYKARFQIKFLFRDAKQHTGLTHCQARSENKIHFHTNTALTAVGVAKITHYFEQEKTNQIPYSIADIKTSYFNELMLDLFLSNFEIDPNLKKNKKAIKRILEFGKIAS